MDRQREEPRTLRVFRWLFLAVLLLPGCGDDSTSAKRSHFEHDHHVAAHRPRDLADTADKIRQRLKAISGDASDVDVLSDEIADLVSWAPEIAADTELGETDWLPIYHAAESLTANLTRPGNEITEDQQQELLAFCDLIDRSSDKINQSLASFESPNP